MNLFPGPEEAAPGVEARPKVTVVFFDQAVAFGGSVVVLAHLFRHIDRDRFTPKLVTGLDHEALGQLFDPADVLCRYRPPLGYVAMVRWMSLCPLRTSLVRRFWAYLFTAVSMPINLPAYVALLYKVARARPDLLHVNSGPPVLPLATVLRVPIVRHLHGLLNTSDRSMRSLRRHASRFIAVSDYVSSTALQCGISKQSIETIPNPAPVDAPSDVHRAEVLARFRLPPDAFVLAHVGRLVAWKGQLEFLKAFISIASAHPKAVALLVGDDLEGFRTSYVRDLRQLAQDAGLADRIVFAGHVSNTLELMSSVDIVVHSSIEPEPFGLVITEAMAAGAPVIAARSGAPVEIIDHGVNGLLAEPRNTEELAAALLLLIEDESLRTALAEAGQRMVRERYSPAEYARRLEAVYERVVRRD